MNEYPTDAELEKIEKWDFLKGNMDEFLKFLESIWWMPDWGFRLRKNARPYHPGNLINKKRVWHLALHTGGWSGNESIMAALEKNFIFWAMCWVESRRGGHYKFEINKPLFEPTQAPVSVKGEEEQ